MAALRSPRSRVVLQLRDGPLELHRSIELAVALDLAQDDRRVAEQVEAVVTTRVAPALQPSQGERPLLREVLAVALAALARRKPEGSHVGLEERRVHLGLGEGTLLDLGDVEAGQTYGRHRTPSRP